MLKNASITILFFLFLSCDNKPVSNMGTPTFPKRLLIFNSNIAQNGSEVKNVFETWVKMMTFKGVKVEVKELKMRRASMDVEGEKNKAIQLFQPDAILELWYSTTSKAMTVTTSSGPMINGGMLSATMGVPNQFTKVWMHEIEYFGNENMNTPDKIAGEMFKQLTDKMIADKVLH